MDGFLSPAQIASLRDTMRRGNQTVQDLQNPAPIIQIRRMGSSGRFESVGEPLHVIRIRFGIREMRLEDSTPVTTSASDGDLKMWESDFDAQPIKTGDRFTWQGRQVEITAVYPPRNDTVVAEIELRQ